MELRRVHSAGGAGRGNFFTLAYFLAFFHKQPVVMGISGNPTVIMLNENKVAKSFEFVSGISHRSGIGSLNRFTELGFNVYAVIVAAFADGPVRRDDFTF